MKSLKKFFVKFLCCKRSEDENPLLEFYSSEEIGNFESILAEIGKPKKSIFHRIFKNKKEGMKGEKKRVYIDSDGNVYVIKFMWKKFVPVLADIPESLEE